jgi:hypothetical protein
MTSKVSIISNAFILLGEYPVNDINVLNPIHSAASIVYDRLLSSILSKYPWRFAIEHQDLSLLSTPTNNDEWTYAFALPTVPSMLWLYRIYPTTEDYIIYQDKLFANINEIAIDYIFQPPENKFPSYFVNLLVHQVTAEIAFLITKNLNVAANFNTLAQREIVNAMAQDAQQFTNPVIQRDEIYGSHFT